MNEPGDDDKTPPRGKRPRPQWDDDRRAAVGREPPGGESGGVSTASERRRQRARPHTADHVERELGSVPEDLGGREITEPWEILDRDLLPNEKRIVQRSKRKSDDPLLVDDGAKLWSRLIQKELDDRSAQKKLANDMLAVIDTTPSGKLAARVDALERASQEADKAADLRLKTLEKDATFARNAAMSTLVFLLLSVGAAGIWLGIREEKLANVIDSVKDLDREVKHIRWAPSKDNTP